MKKYVIKLNFDASPIEPIPQDESDEDFYSQAEHSDDEYSEGAEGDVTIDHFREKFVLAYMLSDNLLNKLS